MLAPDLSSNCYSILDGFKYPPLQLPTGVNRLGDLFLFAASSFLGIGQFARLLPSVEVVAVSQAPSPESNPNPPLPSTPWQSTTRPSLADRAVVRQKTLKNSAFARNELSQHFFSDAAVSTALVLISFIRRASHRRFGPKASPTWNGEHPFDSCISLAFRQGIQSCGNRKMIAAVYV